MQRCETCRFLEPDNRPDYAGCGTCRRFPPIVVETVALDELRAEWEAERPAVVVPMSAKMWAESVLNLRGAINATCEREAARFILSLNGAKGGE